MSAIDNSIYIVRIFAGFIFGFAKFASWVSVTICGIFWLWACYKKHMLVYDNRIAQALAALVISYIACYLVSRFWTELEQALWAIDNTEGDNVGELTMEKSLRPWKNRPHYS